MKTELGQLLVEVKIADAKVRRNKSITQAGAVYADMVAAVANLYAFIREKSISDLEKLCK